MKWSSEAATSRSSPTNAITVAIAGISRSFPSDIEMAIHCRNNSAILKVTLPLSAFSEVFNECIYGHNLPGD